MTQFHLKTSQNKYEITQIINASLALELFMGRVIRSGSKIRLKFERIWVTKLGSKMNLGQKIRLV